MAKIPDIQVYSYDEHTVILRQNMAIDCEAPFMFLMFGNDQAVLIDTGATASADIFPLRRVVDDLVADWLLKYPRHGYRLLVLHTHPQGDHVAGDAQFADHPDTEVVDASLGSAWEYFGFRDDPGRVAHVDLGGRVLECFASPGHHEAAVTFYDPHTGILLTGDTVYPILTTYQPDEPPLQMKVAQLSDIRTAIDEIGDRPCRRAFPAFILCPEDA